MRYFKQKNRFFRHLLTYPLIFLAVIPIIILDIWVEMYHRFCFPLYKIPVVSRKAYIKIDRHKLSYLNPIQKLNCMYCGYANGVVNYWRKIFAETEHYWCGIQHQEDSQFNTPEHHVEFVPYNNEDQFKSRYLNNE